MRECSGVTRVKVSEIFGTNVFNDAVMRERLPRPIYKALKKTIDEGLALEREVAEVVAAAMKDWAIEKGATHFTHWFQPMNGITAEKHEAFISPTEDGRVITEFSGKELIKGESDASSFPSGGLRATFEARGYTVWDCTSPAFLKEDASGVTLCIPTAFCSYTGEALDKKTPLLRSMEALSNQAVRVLRLFGNSEVKRVIPTVGPEQEYFLIDRELFLKRKDLVYTGRTLFGAKPPKGQELEDHYFGSLKERVSAFMKELDIELWKLGVSAKTKHNEVAPAQHELAPIFTNVNIATDHNQLIMDTMKKVANRHGLACLLHEKPFAGVNGSGKHNNWSLSTDNGQNLLEPGKTPHENIQFLVFLCAVIKAIDIYSDLLRASAANPGNDHRLGGNEAPPSIISIFLGEHLTNILERIENGVTSERQRGEKLYSGVSTLPLLRKDDTDRNRTSPFAFTGNKFEFRMVPSSSSVSDANVVLNTIVADSLKEIADRLETVNDVHEEIKWILKDIISNHKRIIFNGDGYSKEWLSEAEKRGLRNIKSTVEAVEAYITKEAVELFSKHNVLSEQELRSRYEIALETYIKRTNIEALTMIEMSNKQIIPAVIKYMNEVATSLNQIKATNLNIQITEIEKLVIEISETLNTFKIKVLELESLTQSAQKLKENIKEQARYYRDVICKSMEELRLYGDKLENMVDSKIWPIPTYGELMFFI
ncbi:glutamine synthetase III [Fervidicella metallireducens]|uniref:glutamine synthetase III family protein n=1 Tax=Fervidicella metallireducens TaxID=655338 RepID=UPI000688A640|nr:glutamine synthetase III [Fervidicella metallireducens]